MKGIGFKFFSIFLVVGILMSTFAACNKKKKEEIEWTPPSSTEESTTRVNTTQPQEEASRISDAIFRQALEQKGFEDWDGDFSSLTDEMREEAAAYFAGLGKKLEIREDGAYLSKLMSDDLESTDPDDESMEPGEEGTVAGNDNKATTSASGSSTPGKKGVKLKSVSIPEKGMVVAKNTSKKIVVKFEPANAEKNKNTDLNWKSSNEKVAKVSADGTVRGIEEGMAKITCTSKENSSIKAECEVAVVPAAGGSLVSYQYDKDNQFFFTEDDPWQRNFGFNPMYDQLAPFSVMYMDSVRMKFRHDASKRDYMIQFWKGQYGWVFVGSEIGIYTKPFDRIIDHYDCATDEQSLMMDMHLYQMRKGSNDYTWEFSRNYMSYWWPTGFIPGMLQRFADRSTLVMTTRITLKDQQMTDAFVKALKDQGFKQASGAVTYKNPNKLVLKSGDVTSDQFLVKGKDVYVCWHKINHPENPLQVNRKDKTTTDPSTEPETAPTEPETTEPSTAAETTQ